MHALVQAINDFLYIKKMNNVHTCGAVVRTTRNQRMSSELIGSVIAEKICSSPLTRPIKVLRDFKKLWT